MHALMVTCGVSFSIGDGRLDKTQLEYIRRWHDLNQPTLWRDAPRVRQLIRLARTFPPRAPRLASAHASGRIKTPY